MRRTFAGRITRDQLVGDVLHIPGSRTKPPYELPLSYAALELLHAHWGRMWAFEPLGPWGPLKSALDREVQGVAKWTIHDIRHTVRSLLSRVATSDIAERCLGHALTGQRKTYDHHDYIPEMRSVMEALASLLTKIVESSGSPGEGRCNTLIRGA
jgi:integrase